MSLAELGQVVQQQQVTRPQQQQQQRQQQQTLNQRPGTGSSKASKTGKTKTQLKKERKMAREGISFDTTPTAAATAAANDAPREKMTEIMSPFRLDDELRGNIEMQQMRDAIEEVIGERHTREIDDPIMSYLLNVLSSQNNMNSRIEDEKVEQLIAGYFFETSPDDDDDDAGDGVTTGDGVIEGQDTRAVPLKYRKLANEVMESLRERKLLRVFDDKTLGTGVKVLEEAVNLGKRFQDQLKEQQQMIHKMTSLRSEKQFGEGADDSGVNKNEDIDWLSKMEQQAQERKARRMLREDNQRAKEYEEFLKSKGISNTRGVVKVHNNTSVSLRDLHLENFSISAGTRELLSNADLTLTIGRHYGLVGLNGLGKCWGKGTGILMYDGTLRPVEDLKFGDLLMGDDGTPRRIISEPIHGKGQMYRITPSSQAPGRPFSCNDDHILVLRLSGEPHIRDKVCKNRRRAVLQYMQSYVDDDGDVIVRVRGLSREYGPNKLYKNYDEAKAELEIALNDLSQQDNYVNPDTYIWEVRAEAFFEKAEPAVKNRAMMYMPGAISFPAREGFLRRTLQEVIGATPTDDQVRAAAYLLGSWLGDGCHSRPRIYVAASEKEHLNALHHAIKQLGCVVTVSDTKGDGTLLSLYIKAMRDSGCNNFLALLRSLNIYNNKHIPEELVLDELVNVRYHLLAGLLDTDGSFNPYFGYEFVQKRKQITDMVHRIANNSGFRSNNVSRTLKTATNGKRKTKEEYWRCHITGPDMSMLPISIPRKQDPGPSSRATEPNKRHLLWGFTVTKLDRSEEEDYYGFTVDGNSRLLLADNTVTHNTTLLRHIVEREIPGIPPYMQILHIEQEVISGEETALQMVLRTDVERERLLEEEQQLLEDTSEQASTRLAEVYARMDEINAHSAEARAASLLAGLGFTSEMQNRPTKQLSGGWRMRVALARALFVEPDLLLLDEPTNHLDLVSSLWLENYLQKWKKTLIVVSHSKSFLNAISTDIIHLHNKTLDAYKGDYFTFEKTRNEKLKQQQKAHEAQEKQRAHIQSFIDRFRYKASTAKMAQSRIKMLEKMDFIPAVVEDPTFTFEIPSPEAAPPPYMQAIDVAFGYSEDKILFKKLNFNLDMDSRIALVGNNGSGKSTFLKLLNGEVQPLDGTINRNRKIRVAKFSQHHVDQLNMQMTPLEHMKSKYPKQDEQDLRAQLGRFGLSGNLALQPIYTLSGGQKSRVSFAEITYHRPHILLMDEPTNHLDTDSVDALIQAVNAYQGGIMLISHDEYFISNVADEIWVCGNGRILPWAGTFDDYKKAIYKELSL